MGATLQARLQNHRDTYPCYGVPSPAKAGLHSTKSAKLEVETYFFFLYNYEMNYLKAFDEWTHNPFYDNKTKEALRVLNPKKDIKEIEDRFYQNLAFGTGGLRGVMGAGTNRINQYTVGRATLGLANYLATAFGKKACLERGVVIAYDTRNNSSYYARIATDVLTGQGIKTFLFKKEAPTPQLSFAVRHLNCIGGIVITASHNPKEYNGYKVYDEFGCQIVPHQAEAIIAFINRISDYTQIPFEGNDDLVEEVDILDAFISEVSKQALMITDTQIKKELKIVYTPLHGTGNVPVQKVLSDNGFYDVSIVKEQESKDGNFPTVKSPNPENREALSLGLKYAEKIKADIVFGTDPDADRVGVGVRTADGYKLLTGNQIGALLMEYVLSNKNLLDIKHPAVIKTVVTSELGTEIAKSYGVEVFTTLTGFKYIGEKITQFEQAKLNNDTKRDYDFIFGYEESYGYLAGTHARDKDAVVSCLLISEMAAIAKAKGLTLLDRMNAIYQKYGFYKDHLDSFTLKGKDGLEKIASIMEMLRKSDSPFDNTRSVIDYNKPVKEHDNFGLLPVSDVLQYVLHDNSWIAVRPSGTEPKIKVYFSVRGDTMEIAERKLEDIRNKILTRMNFEN